MDGACLASRWKTNEEKNKWRTRWNEIAGVTAPKMDGQYTGDHDGTYAIARNKLERIREQRKIERICFGN